MAPTARTREDARVSRLHSDELSIDTTLVRRLVDRSFPEYSCHAVVRARDAGSSNALFRLGDDMLVRLPRQPGGGATIEKEAQWLPFVAPRTTVAVPRVLGVGAPALGYSEQWAITEWIDGARAVPPRPGSGTSTAVGLAMDLARFMTELRAMDVPPGATEDETLTWYRGQPLAALDTDFRGAAGECRALGLPIDVDDALRVWDHAVESSTEADATPTWYHGDLLAENLLLDESGRLSAVLDFGGLAIGSPTVDLVVAWEVLDEEGRRELRTALDVDDATWTASRGWALLIAMITFPYYGAVMPRRCSDRLLMARAAIAGS